MDWSVGMNEFERASKEWELGKLRKELSQDKPDTTLVEWLAEGAEPTYEQDELGREHYRLQLETGVDYNVSELIGDMLYEMYGIKTTDDEQKELKAYIREWLNEVFQDNYREIIELNERE